MDSARQLPELILLRILLIGCPALSACETTEDFYDGEEQCWVAGGGLIRVMAGVGSIAGVIAVAIAWRVAHRPEAASFFPILGWQLLFWLPWVGAYAFFFVFWFLIDLLPYWAILARPEPDREALEESASHATTKRFAVRKGRSQHLVRTADIRCQMILAETSVAAGDANSSPYCPLPSDTDCKSGQSTANH